MLPMLLPLIQVPKGIAWDEVKVGEKLLEFRTQQEVNQGASFGTIGKRNNHLLYKTVLQFPNSYI